MEKVGEGIEVGYMGVVTIGKLRDAATSARDAPCRMVPAGPLCSRWLVENKIKGLDVCAMKIKGN